MRASALTFSLVFSLMTPTLAQATSATPAYCQKQRLVCRTLCNQVTEANSSRRAVCDGGCDQSMPPCLSSGSYSFAPVEQFMPEFHRQ